MAVYSITTEGEIALSASATKTVLALFGTTSYRVRIIEWGMFFDGISVTAEPVRVGISRFTADNGTRTTTTTEFNWDPDAGAAAAVGRHNYTAEPTTSGLLTVEEVHVQSGTIKQYPFGREIFLSASTSDGIGLTVFTPTVIAANVVGYLAWEE